MNKLRTIKTVKGKKARAWKTFSQYIRLRDCIATTGDKDRGRCITCGKLFPYDKLQAGHAIPGRNTSILFDEELVAGQCVHCNIFLGGNLAIYSLKFIYKHGLEAWEEKIRLSNEAHERPDYDEVTLKYKDKIDKLLKEYND